MRTRTTLAAFLLYALAASPAPGQEENLRGTQPFQNPSPDMPAVPNMPGEEPPGAAPGEPTGEAPAAEAEPEVGLEQLFAQLREAPTEQAAKPIEQAIWAKWLESGSDTADLLMVWAAEALEAKDFDLSLKYLDMIIALKPGYAEAWNKRATVHYLNKDYSRSIADLRRVLSLEPRHFAAISGLALILQDIGEKDRALDAYRRALAIHPHIPHVERNIEELSVEVEGREI